MVVKKTTLKKYKSKRDFTKTPEPTGNNIKKSKDPIFVIHEHQARSHHFDFRLESEGVLKSWAIPKGPSTNPAEKHLAIQVEDHPYEYKSFEGVIPEGQYGAGPVIIWDSGTFKNLKDDSLSKCIENGSVAVWLKGKKLKGGYALIRTKFRENKDWLFFKMKDEKADIKTDIQKEKPKSVVSHKTIEDAGRAPLEKKVERKKK